jgi:uncharacterized integral membrane protein
MLDFFRDLILEARGIDAKAAADERALKAEQRKIKKFIFSAKMKIFVLIGGILYLILTIITTIIIWGTENYLMYVFKNIGMCLIDVFICGCIISGKKKAEIFALIGIIIFFALLFLSINILI